MNAFYNNVSYSSIWIDIDECSTNNGSCQQNCRNTDGSFTCHCRSGYSLMSDSKTCTGRDFTNLLVYVLLFPQSCVDIFKSRIKDIQQIDLNDQ
jgi:hypothetical protein